MWSSSEGGILVCVWSVCVSTVVHALESEMVTTSWQLPHHCLMSAGQHSDTLLAYYVSTLFTPETRGAEKPGNHCIPNNFCVCRMRWERTGEDVAQELINKAAKRQTTTRRSRNRGTSSVRQSAGLWEGRRGRDGPLRRRYQL